MGEKQRTKEKRATKNWPQMKIGVEVKEVVLDEKAESAARKQRARPGECKRVTKEKMTDAWTMIVDELVVRAKMGSYNHTKMLVELSGINDEEAELPRERIQISLSEILKKELQQQSETKAESKAGRAKAERPELV